MTHTDLNKTTTTLRRRCVIGIVVMAQLSAAGCAELVNPWRDDLPKTSLITTPSARRVHEANKPDVESKSRGWQETTTQTQDQGVSHGPLWWMDPLEDSGSDDGQFAWTWLDYAAIAYCPARQTLNTVALPVSVIADPPWAVRCSDGTISKQVLGLQNHDPVSCSGEAAPPDVIEVYDAPQARDEDSQDHPQE